MRTHALLSCLCVAATLVGCAGEESEPESETQDLTEDWSVESLHSAPDRVVINYAASVASDGSGTLHVASIGEDNAAIYGSRAASGSWQWENIGGDESGEFARITLGPDAAPHVTYYDRGQGSAVHASKGADGLWSSSLVDVGAETDVAVDAGGTVHVVGARIADAGPPYLSHIEYASRPAGGDWSFETIDDGSDAGRPSVAVGADGAIYVAYLANTTDKLMLAERPVGGTWSRVPLNIASNNAEPSLAVDASGLHLAYGNDSEIFYVQRSGSTWTAPEKVSGGDGYDPNLRISPTGGLVIAFTGNEYSAVRLAERDSAGAWQAELIRSDYAENASVALDPSGAPHVLYRDRNSNAFKHASRRP